MSKAFFSKDLIPNKFLLWGLVILILMGFLSIFTMELKAIANYFPLIKRFFSILLIVITILAIGFFLAWYVADNMSQFLARQVLIKIDLTEK